MVFADIHDDKIIVLSEYYEKDLLKQIPGSKFDSKLKIWTLPKSWAACVQLRGIFNSQLEIGPSLLDWSKLEYNYRIVPSLEAVRSLYLSDNGSLGAEKIKTWRNPDSLQLYPYQEAAAQWLARAGNALLADEMGTGKTASLLSATRLFHELFTTGLPAIVICPNTIKNNWMNEASMWFKECHPYVVTGGAVQKRKILKQAKDDPLALVIINFESIRLYSRLSGFGNIRLKKCIECDPTIYDEEEEKKFRADKPAACEVHIKELNGFGFKTAIIDEAHRIKDPKAKQTRAIWAVLQDETVQRRWAATGTPISDNLADLWTIFHAICPEEAPVKSKYVDRYAVQSFNQFGGMEVLGLKKENKEELFKIIDPRIRRVTKDVVLPWLPKKVYQQHLVEMVPKQKKAYEEIGASLYTKLDDGSVLVARKNVSAQTRLLQLTSSYCKVDRITCSPCNGLGLDNQTDDGLCEHCSGSGIETIVEPAEPSPKIDALVDLLNDLKSKPIVVAAEQRKLLELTSARLEKEKIPHVMITGKVTEAQRTLNLSMFEQGKTPVLLFTYKAGGVGLNMTAADTMVRLQLSWSMIFNLQGEDRIHRPGAEKHQSINIVDITTQNTVEENQRTDFIEKKERLEEITRDKERKIEAGLPVDTLDSEAQAIMGSTLLGG